MGKPRKIRNAIIKNQKWLIKWQKLQEGYIIGKGKKREYVATLGLCDWEDKTIYINPRQSEKEYLLTLLHEACHSLFRKSSEKTIARIEKELGDILWRAGCRFKN
mgnify:CR=1 FL=1